MQKHPAQTKQRLRLFASERGLRGHLYPSRFPVELSVFHAPDRISYTEAMQGSYQPAHVGEQFGPEWSTHWFKVDIAIPDDWAGQEVHLLWNSSSEACIWQDGKPLQGLTAIGWGSQEPVRPAYRLTRKANHGEKITLYIEMACNNLFGVHPQFEYRLRQAEIAVFERQAWDLLWDFTILAEMSEHLPDNTPRAGQALYAANAMINACNLDDRTTWSKARQIAADFLADRNGDAQHNLSAIGHAHIDSAWLWPLAETQRKCIRTFSSAILLMDDYPDYKFTCSQAQQYEWMKTMQPYLYEKIKVRVKEGRFIPVGGTWVEPDCNLPSGESLVRQFLYGQRFFRQEFGITCNIFWNPDVFGYSAALPQIMRKAGIEYFLTQKLSWNDTNKPANQTFLWEGLDGSQVLTHFPPADTYNAMADVKEVLFSVSNFKEHDRARESYMLFGYGDGGGGPTAEMLERIQRMKDVDGLPRVEIRSPQEFFTRCAADMKEPVTWVGELYFELHRGTYTSQAANKRDNRRSEFLLHDIELLATLARVEKGAAYPSAELDRLWKLVLLNQFHDIIPGSSITLVYQDSSRHYADILATGARLRDQALETLHPSKPIGDHILAFNTLSAARREIVELPFEANTPQRAANGKPLAALTAPGLGYQVQPLSGPTISEAGEVSLVENPQGFILENDLARATFNREGRLVSLFDLRMGREAIESGAVANNFVLFEDEPPQWEAWDVYVFHLEKRQDLPPATSARVLETGPLRAAIAFEYELSPQSWLKQTVSLTSLSPRLDFATEVEWHEKNRFLKVEFPLKIRADQATYEIQFGHVQRPTHFNTSYDLARFEVSTHRWADLSEPGFGVALLNDSKYGYATHRNVMRLSLLRSPKHPDPVADMGHHHFRYALLMHSGSFREAGVIQEGYRFNEPMLICPTSGPLETKSYFSADRPSVIIDTVKKAEDSEALIVRLYEAYGSRGPIRLTSPLPVKFAAFCNLLEEEDLPVEWKDGGVTFSIQPFQLVTIKLAM